MFSAADLEADGRCRFSFEHLAKVLGQVRSKMKSRGQMGFVFSKMIENSFVLGFSHFHLFGLCLAGISLAFAWRLLCICSAFIWHVALTYRRTIHKFLDEGRSPDLNRGPSGIEATMQPLYYRWAIVVGRATYTVASRTVDARARQMQEWAVFHNSSHPSTAQSHSWNPLCARKDSG